MNKFVHKDYQYVAQPFESWHDIKLYHQSCINHRIKTKAAAMKSVIAFTDKLTAIDKLCREINFFVPIPAMTENFY